jgi:transposase
MFGLGPATRVYVATGATDMRKGFEGLYGLVRDRLGADPQSGHVFLFANRTRTRVKLLVWDRSGLWVCVRRLERARFGWPEAAAGEARVVLRPVQLGLLLQGIELADVRFRKAWLRPENAA